MKAITVRQPYASPIGIGRKTVENRPRPCSYRGEIAIHAAVAEHRTGRTDPRITAYYGPDPTVGMPRGAIIAVADLIDCHRAGLCTGAGCYTWGNPDSWHLMLAAARMLDRPVPARGSLAVPWNVPTDVEALVREQLGPVTA